MKMYINGRWTDAPQMTPITRSYTGETVDTVPVATPEQVEQTLAAASKAAKVMGAMPAYKRAEFLNRAADLIDGHVEELAQLVSLEVGKPISEARGEAGRIGELLRLSVFEGTQLRGETLPIDAHRGAGKDKLGLTMRVPCGVVVAISPFNYPLLLVMHKIGPALSAGNAVILKPANQTPLAALKLTELLYEAGLPENGLQTITGSGSRIGPALCADSRVRKISFTGSTGVGEQITRVAGVKKLSLELGSSCPMIVMPDADLAQVAEATATGGFVNAGQVCISLQRVIVHKDIYADYLEAVKGPVEAIKVGDSLADDTQLSAMVSEQEAERVGAWIDEAVQGGARVITGGQRQGAVFAPTIVADVKPDMRISCDEIFGPAISVLPVADIDEAIAVANGVNFGLGSGIFTRDINTALRFARDAESGMVMINWSPLWRADLMPYGGFKGSGIGKEGPRYAVEEMTEIKTVVFHGF
jgi:glyceraldehyde-3-phosphate dehydrogenase (NADP+)